MPVLPTLCTDSIGFVGRNSLRQGGENTHILEMFNNKQENEMKRIFMGVLLM